MFSLLLPSHTSHHASKSRKSQAGRSITATFSICHTLHLLVFSNAQRAPNVKHNDTYRWNMSLPKLIRPNSTGGSTKLASPSSGDPATAASQHGAIDATPMQQPGCNFSFIKDDTCTLCLVLDEGGSSRSNFGQISASKTNGCGGCSLIIEAIMSMKARREIHSELTVRLQSENGYLYIKLPIHTLQPIALFCLEGILNSNE